MTLNQQPELKEAILRQTEKDKDKLLVRLINKDKRLMEQLHYQLLENENDLYSRIQEVKNKIEETFNRAKKGIAREKAMYQHKELTGYLKSASGLVNEHASITKNKESELDLRLLILEEAFDQFRRLYTEQIAGYKADTHFIYQAARIKSILGLYDKLHEDLQYEYRKRLVSLMEFVHKTLLRDYVKGIGIETSTYLF